MRRISVLTCRWPILHPSTANKPLSMREPANGYSAFDEDNRKALSTGTLLLVDNIVNQASATIRLKAMFANDDERLWPGDFVNARLLLETRSNALVVPSSAVQRGPQGLFAWVVTEKNIADVQSIEVGPSTGNLTIITSGLADGERVVTDGQYKLQRNSPVLVNTPPPARIKGN